MTILIVVTAIAALVGLVAIALGVSPADVPSLVQKGLGSISHAGGTVS